MFPICRSLRVTTLHNIYWEVMLLSQIVVSYPNNILTVMGPTRREACGSICKLVLLDMVQKHRQGRTNGKQSYRGQGRRVLK